MRKALNDNPMVQIGVLGVLAVVVGFFLITQMGKGSSASSTTSSPTSSSAAPAAPDASAAPTDSSATATTPSASTATTPSTAAPSTTPGATASATTPAAPAAGAAAPGTFVAGPGLPSPVVNAYKANKVVVLLVVRRGGIDDDAVKSSLERMNGLPDAAIFVTNAGHVSRYSRIASGVDLDRVPALIVLRPQKLTNGTPTATVSYGFRGPESVAQAIADALYKGPTDLPYYPK
jgi:hypothetical protein